MTNLPPSSHPNARSLVIDLKATCCDADSVSDSEMDIIEIGAVAALLSGDVSAVWSSRVRPVRPPRLTGFCTGLTGIAQRDVDAADALPEVLPQFSAWLQREGADISAWASWGADDVHQWRQDLNHHALAWSLPAQHVSLKALFAKRH